jgi:A/G-specific adenine glycosylase
VTTPARRDRSAGTARAQTAPRIRIPATVRLEFGRRLRAWYRKSARDLPWRRTRDPYAVLVSELMLQQTQVVRVVPKYSAFLQRFPTLASVAESQPSQVMEAWEGLGYYARARALHRLARIATPALPAGVAALRALPGIGAYTAGAVASFAFERPAALVDTNVARVLTRVFTPRLDPRTARGRRAAWAIAEATLPRAGPTAYAHNQALIELGALICTARVAHCSTCPVRRVCKTAGNSTAKSAGTSAAAANDRRPRHISGKPSSRYRPAGPFSTR